jgi:hypothetical protein
VVHRPNSVAEGHADALVSGIGIVELAVRRNESSWMGVNFFTFVHSYDGALDTILKELDGTILDQFLPDDSVPNGLEVIFPDTSRVIAWGFDATNGFDTVGNWKSLHECYGFNIYGVYGESGKYSCTGSCDLNGDCTDACIAN